MAKPLRKPLPKPVPKLPTEVIKDMKTKKPLPKPVPKPATGVIKDMKTKLLREYIRVSYPGLSICGALLAVDEIRRHGELSAEYLWKDSMYLQRVRLKRLLGDASPE